MHIYTTVMSGIMWYSMWKLLLKCVTAAIQNVTLVLEETLHQR